MNRDDFVEVVLAIVFTPLIWIGMCIGGDQD